MVLRDDASKQGAQIPQIATHNQLTNSYTQPIAIWNLTTQEIHKLRICTAVYMA